MKLEIVEILNFCQLSALVSHFMIIIVFFSFFLLDHPLSYLHDVYFLFSSEPKTFRLDSFTVKQKDDFGLIMEANGTRIITVFK